jgi:hypothetical protein
VTSLPTRVPAPDPAPDPAGARRRRGALALLAGSVTLLFAGAGAAFAVSGGGYQPDQQGCQPGDADYATPTGQTYAGCHNTALNVESGGTTQGNPDASNTRYAQFGLDQSPNDPNSQGTPTPYSLGEPGQSGSPHAFCASVNTAGTGAGPAPRKAGPTAPGQAADSPNGCGGNPAGLGASANVDYYQLYCPLAAAAGNPCEATSWGTSTLTPYTGSTVAYQPIVDNGVIVYYGMDDNTDNGEHDGLGPYSTGGGQHNKGAINGPSDGGAILLVLTPMKAGTTPSQTQPEGAVNASTGFCADGICTEATTEQQTVYHGCGARDSYGKTRCDRGTPQSANVYDYAPGGSTANDPSVSRESPNCNSGSAANSGTAACGPGGMDALRAATPANENAEPGVQVYSDPDPQRSPAAPSPLWPTPALYAGTCGVYAGSPATTGQVLGSSPQAVGPFPVTNQAGQVAFDPNPSAC